MAREACEHFYRVTIFTFSLQDLNHVDKFLGHDLLRTGTVPRDIVCKVAITMHMNAWEVDALDTLKRLTDALNSFSSLSSQRQAHLFIVLEGDRRQAKRFSDVLHKLAAPLYKLKDIGSSLWLEFLIHNSLHPPYMNWDLSVVPPTTMEDFLGKRVPFVLQ